MRAAMQQKLSSIDYAPSSLGLRMIEAAYSPEGAAWVDAQIAHLQGNRAVFDAGINAIPGVHSLPLEATFLVDPDGAICCANAFPHPSQRMEPADIRDRVLEMLHRPAAS